MDAFQDNEVNYLFLLTEEVCRHSVERVRAQLVVALDGLHHVEHHAAAQVYTHTYIYIHTERKREGERDRFEIQREISMHACHRHIFCMYTVYATSPALRRTCFLALASAPCPVPDEQQSSL